MALNRPCSFPWIPGPKVKGDPWHMSVPKIVFQYLEIALLKYHILGGNSYWLDLIMTKPFLIGHVDTAMDIPNGNILDQISNNLLPGGGANSLISTWKTFEFFVAVNDISNHNGG